MNVRQEVLDILDAAAGKLRRTRALEMAAVGAIAGGLCAAALEAAWIFAGLFPAAAVLICALPAAFAVVLVGSRRLRAAVSVAPSAVAALAGLCAASALAGAVGVMAGWHAAVPKMAIGLLLTPVGAAATAAGAILRGVAPREAAVYHDLRLRLGERLSTAAELAASDRPDRPLARCLYAQALDVLRRERPERLPVWRRTGATAGALGLSAALWVTLAFLPDLGIVDVHGSLTRLSNSVERLPAGRRKDLAATLRRLAQQTRGRPELLAALRAAAQAAEKDLPEQVKRALDRTRDALAGHDEVEAARIAQALLAAAGLGGESDGSDGGLAARSRPAGRRPNGRLPPDANTVAGDTGERPLARRVAVWDPAYAKSASRGDANWPSTEPGAGSGGVVPFRDAWAAARARAAGALAGEGVPGEYRRLVRRFFEVP